MILKRAKVVFPSSPRLIGAVNGIAQTYSSRILSLSCRKISMADRPILFSAPMVRALLDGRKTQTRRVLSKSNLLFNGGRWPKGLALGDMRLDGAWVDGGPSPTGNPGQYLKADWPYGRLVEGDEGPESEWLMARLYPRTQPGDRLWVKETHAEVAEGRLWVTRADYPECVPPEYENVPTANEINPWRPSIFMPRKRSRLTLPVVDVRIERLNDCSEEDAIAEGVQPLGGSGSGPYRFFIPIEGGSLSGVTAVETYALLWNVINGEGAWQANPWVIASTFAVSKTNIDERPI